MNAALSNFSTVVTPLLSAGNHDTRASGMGQGPQAWLTQALKAAVADKADNPPLRILLTAKDVAELDALALDVELPAAGDGNCFLRCLAYAFYGAESAHPLVQALVVLHLAGHEERYAPHVAGEDFTAQRCTKQGVHGIFMLCNTGHDNLLGYDGAVAREDLRNLEEDYNTALVRVKDVTSTALKTRVLRLLEITKRVGIHQQVPAFAATSSSRAASSFASAAAASSSAALAVHLSTISSAALTSAAFSSGTSAELRFHSSLASATPSAVSSVALSFAAPSCGSAAAHCSASPAALSTSSWAAPAAVAGGPRRSCQQRRSA